MTQANQKGKPIKLKEIKVDDSFFIREGYDRDAIERYKDQYSSENNELPPLLLQKDTNILIDGFHRLRALKELKQEFAWVAFLETDNPFLEAVKRNIEHGVPLTKYERDQIIEHLYVNHNLTQEQVAEVIGLSRSRVAEILGSRQVLSETDITSKDEDQDDNGNSTILDKRRTLNKAEITEILELCLGGDLSQRAISDKYTISRQRVNQLFREFKEDLVRKYQSGWPLEFLVEETYPTFTESQLIEILKGNKGISDQLLGTPRIIHGDLFQKIGLIPDESVDLIYVDPPYNITSEDWDSFESEETFRQFTQNWLEAIFPKLKATGQMFVSFSQQWMWLFYEILTNLKKDHDIHFADLIIWHYPNIGGDEKIKRKAFRYSWDPIFYLRREQSPEINMPEGKNWGKDGDFYGNDVWKFTTPQSNYKGDLKKVHPTQKPVSLLREIVIVGSKKGDLVFDPFAGVGTTALACIEQGRDYVCIEIDPEFVQIMNERIREALR